MDVTDDKKMFQKLQRMRMHVLIKKMQLQRMHLLIKKKKLQETYLIKKALKSKNVEETKSNPVSTAVTSSTGFSFGNLTSSPADFSFGTSNTESQSLTTSKPFSFGLGSNTAMWESSSCSVKNPEIESKCKSCELPRPPKENSNAKGLEKLKTMTIVSSSISQSITSPPEPSGGFVFGTPKSDAQNTALAQFSFGSDFINYSSDSSEEEKRKKKKHSKGVKNEKSKSHNSSGLKVQDHVACTVDPDETPAVPENNLMRGTSPVADYRSDEFGFWEKHTKGFGKKMLLQMGFVPGKGLGKRLQGITSPINMEFKIGKGGIGFHGPEQPTMQHVGSTQQSSNVEEDENKIPSANGKRILGVLDSLKNSVLQPSKDGILLWSGNVASMVKPDGSDLWRVSNLTHPETNRYILQGKFHGENEQIAFLSSSLSTGLMVTLLDPSDGSLIKSFNFQRY